MADANSDANPSFIGNPFMKGGMDGVKTKKAPPTADAGGDTTPRNRSRSAPSTNQGRASSNSLPNTVGRPTSPANPSRDRARLSFGRKGDTVAPNRRNRQRSYAEPTELETDVQESSTATSRATRSVNGKTAKSTAPAPGTAEGSKSTKRSGTKSGKRQGSQTGKSQSSKSANSRSKRSTAPAAGTELPPPAVPRGGFKVQVIAKIPVSNNTNLPGRDYLWFANYPVIPRVGDCLFQNGMYFRVDAVFLYENNRPGWCADVEVSYYARRR